MSQTRVMIFMDGSNLHWGIKAYNSDYHTGKRLNYSQLIKMLLKDRTLVRATYYCSVPVPAANPLQVKFLDYLRHIGVQVFEKPLKTRLNPITNAIRYVEKGVDIALAIDLLSMAWENAYDVAVLVSGDADYAGAVTKVMSKGKNVEIAAFRKCIGKELKDVALTTIVLDDYIEEVTSER